MSCDMQFGDQTLALAKWAFTTRRVMRSDAVCFDGSVEQAESGDLVLAEVVKIGQHQNLQLSEGRPSRLVPGDRVVLACGDRYAPDQFEGRAVIDPRGADMLAGGGIIGTARQAHRSMSAPTQLLPLARLKAADGRSINLSDYALPAREAPSNLTVIGVVGSSMNAGKTTATLSLGHGLMKAGYRVAGIKATGTGAFGDYNAMIDAGLPYVADFTDAGMASTYMQPQERIEAGLKALLASAACHGAEIAVVELADGIYQKEAAELLENSRFIRETFKGVMFACGDAVSVVGGVRHLRALGHRVCAVSGLVSLSPLAASEASQIVGMPIFTREDLMTPETANGILSSLTRQELEQVRATA